MRATSALRGSAGLVAGATSALLAVAAGQTTEITTNTTLAPENDRNITENEVNSPLEAHFESSAVIFGLILAGFLLVITLIGVAMTARNYLTDRARRTFRSYHYDSLTETYHLQRDGTEVEMLYFDHPGVLRPTYGSAPSDWARFLRASGVDFSEWGNMFGLALSAVRGLYSLVTTREDDCNLGSSEDGITLIYFDGRGCAEAIRFVLGLAGAQFTERFVRTRADFLQVLEEGHAPFGQLPVLLDGPLTLSNSMACARHVARRFGLYGSGDLREMARIDMVADSALDFYNAGMLAFPFSGDSGKVADSCAKYWPKFEAVLGPQIARGDVCLVGNSPSYADAILLMNALCSLEHDASSLDNYPAVQAWFGVTRAIPTMAAFVASDQRHPPADAKYVREVQVSLGRV